MYKITLFMILSAIVACSQPKSIVKNSYGFFIFQYPGNIPVDENGNPRPGFRGDSIYTVYIESPKKNIKWDTAYIGNKVYRVAATRVQADSVDAGRSNNDRQRIIIKPQHGNLLYYLDFTRIEGAVIPTDKKGSYTILLIGTYKGKRIEFPINELIKLYTPDAV